MSFSSSDSRKAKANVLKEDGNKFYQQGDFKQAELLYTQAIQKDPSEAKFFTNRALTRLDLHAWDGCIDDCLHAIELDKDNMKGYYYLSKAQFELKHPNEAFSSALTAYEKCVMSLSPSVGIISAFVLQCKKAKWEARERERIRMRNALLIELEDTLQHKADYNKRCVEARVKKGELTPDEGKEQSDDHDETMRVKIEEIRNVFAIADVQTQRREVPDYLIDSISFSIMHDPVITKNGHSYDRATLIEHLRRSPTDPMTRESLRLEDCRPNIALREVCEEFLKKNGWAVDW